MKRILLASASVVAFAGAAHADFSISGSTSVWYNDDFNERENGEPGFSNDLDFDVTFTQELNYGLTFAATIGFEYVDSDAGSINNGQTDFGGFTDDNWVVSVTGDMGGFYFGNTAFAAETYWDGVSNMDADDFSEADGETVIRGEVMYAGVTAGVSYLVHNDDVAMGMGTGELDQMSVGATGEFGMFNFSIAYQEEADLFYEMDGDGPDGIAGNDDDTEQFNGDFDTDEVFGIAVGGSFAGADVTLAYAKNQTEDASSLGVEVAYPFGPVTVTGFYVAEDDESNPDQDDNYGVKLDYASGPIAVSAFYEDGGSEQMGVEGSYDVGNGIMVYAGYVDEGDKEDGTPESEYFYIASEIDLGGGASVLFSYADVDDPAAADTALDEIGANDYFLGTTIRATFSF